MTRIRDQRGQTLVLSIVFMTVLLGMAAAVLDVGSWYRADRAAQAAADAAALAGAQALPYDTGRASGLAYEYSGKNGSGIDGVSFPAGKLVPNDTIKVEFSRPAPGFFARLFGLDSVTVRATATARASNITQAKWVAPIVVNEKHPMLTCQPSPCFGEATELKYYHLKDGGGGSKKDDDPAVDGGSGSFGFINLIQAGGNPGTSELGNWIRNGFDAYMPLGEYDARTGNPFSSSNVNGSLQDRIGTEILFPVYRKLTGSGSNAKYEIIGWVGFHLTGMDLQGNNEKLFGYFTQVIWEGIESETGAEPEFGVRTINLVE
ncbi:MAG: pilus assembly protein TadG-related protein [Gaiellaceae bacterium]